MSTNGLLDVSIPQTLLDRELTFLGQTFEGGISSRPDAEAHGAYAFCALACLCILGDPHIMIPR
jgi:prenyltransferase beta subunit